MAVWVNGDGWALLGLGLEGLLLVVVVVVVVVEGKAGCLTRPSDCVDGRGGWRAVWDLWSRWLMRHNV